MVISIFKLKIYSDKKMSIVESVNELEQLSQEIKLVSKQLRALRLRSKKVSADIQTFLREKEQPGVKYQGKAYILEERSKNLYKKKDEIQSDSLEVLRQAGIDNPEGVLDRLLKARKGEETKAFKVKIKKVKQ